MSFGSFHQVYPGGVVARTTVSEDGTGRGLPGRPAGFGDALVEADSTRVVWVSPYPDNL